MQSKVKGIHHVTAIAGDSQTNIDFYTRLLGLKMVKQTVNFDDPHTYHFYYGDAIGNPGTILTFFPWGRNGFKGQRGNGQVATISFSILPSSFDFWIRRLQEAKVTLLNELKRFESEVVLFEDPDGIEIEIIADENESRQPWASKFVLQEHAIRGFHSITLNEANLKTTSHLLVNALGFNETKSRENRTRFIAEDGTPGKIIDVVEVPNSLYGRMGAGAVHHAAFRAEDETAQLNIRSQVLEKNIEVTEVINRKYFKSIYFREPGRVLFEVATDPPGFLVDEDENNLGKRLQLPPWYEEKRKAIESILPKIIVP